ncbi:MAG: hypothetical protein KatS3mg025_0117 [Bacteroidia bacterium]|nr:MAG: hypothetical protein KatS3mg025_0117 [Bacteroidia bacterium]
MQEIRKNAREGVKVKLFAPPHQDIIQLVDEGIEVFLHPYMHAKSLLVDNQEGFIFTANLQEKGLKTGLEVGIRLAPEQVKDLMAIYGRWERTFPYKVKRSVPIQDLDTYYKLGSQNRLEPVKLILMGPKQTKRQKVQKVAELVRFFADINTSWDDKIKKRELELIAMVSPAPDKYKDMAPTDSFSILQEEKVVLISDIFRYDDIKKIKEWEAYDIYYAKKAPPSPENQEKKEAADVQEGSSTTSPSQN